MNYLVNAFSIQMLKGNSMLSFKRVRPELVARADWESAIGHQDTANVLASMLQRVVVCDRKSIEFFEGDTL